MLHLKLACLLGAGALVAGGATFHATTGDCPLGLGDLMRKLHGAPLVRMASETPAPAAGVAPDATLAAFVDETATAPVVAASTTKVTLDCPIHDMIQAIHGKKARASDDCPLGLGEIMRRIHGAPAAAATPAATASTSTSN